jgi:hypothetical protein
LYSTQPFRGLATSVDDEADVQDLSIYPNPADDVVVIDLPDRAMEIIVLDVLGSVVRRVDASVAGTSVNMPVNDLPAGSYSIVIRSDASTTIKPLLIRR